MFSIPKTKQKELSIKIWYVCPINCVKYNYGDWNKKSAKLVYQRPPGVQHKPPEFQEISIHHMTRQIVGI